MTSNNNKSINQSIFKEPVLLLRSEYMVPVTLALGGLGFVLGMSLRVGYCYWARGSGSWAVHVAKKSARAISND